MAKLLLSIICLIIGAVTWVYVDRLITVHFIGYLGRGYSVYAFSEKEIDRFLGVEGAKDSWKEWGLLSLQSKQSLRAKLIDTMPVSDAIATATVGAPSWKYPIGPHNSFVITMPRDRLPIDDNLAIVVVNPMEIWLNVVRIAIDVQSHEIYLDKIEAKTYEQLRLGTETGPYADAN